eukprot:scaffold1154_cov310-Pinguiococcus_pyrenoidosus.AAC.2
MEFVPYPDVKQQWIPQRNRYLFAPRVLPRSSAIFSPYFCLASPALRSSFHQTFEAIPDLKPIYTDW